MRDGTRRSAAAGATLVLLATGVYFGFVRPHASRNKSIDAADDEDLATSAAPPPIAPASSEPTDASPTAAHPVLDKAKRDAMREAIYRAWGMAPPDERTHPSTWPTAPTANGEGFGKDYVRQRIRDDYYPLAKDCYERGLKKNPKLAGKLVASFRIVGTKNTGGLVDWVDTSSEDNTLDDREVLECMKQSLYSVTFDPPPHDGVVTVTYPIEFSPDDRDG